MKFSLVLLLALFVAGKMAAQSFAINATGTAADASAMLDVSSTGKGLLIPRMTTAQRMAIASPAAGLVVYDNSLNQFYYYNGTAWTVIATGNATNYWTLSSSNLYNNSGTNVGIGTTAPSAKLVVSNTTASGGSFKLHNPNNLAADKWWMGFTHGDGLGSVDNNDRARIGVEIAGGGSGRLFFTTGGAGSQTERMRITESGLVGIGTTAPSGKFQVNVTAGNFQVTDFGVAAGTTILGAYNGTSAGAQVRFTGVGAGFVDIGEDASGNFVVEQSDAAKLTVTTAGNVGIGTSSPTTALDVNGKTRTTTFQMTTAAANGYVLQSDAAGNGSWVNTASLAVTETDPQVSSATANYIPKWSGATLTDGVIYDNGTNIGIGTTSPLGKLHVQNTGLLTAAFISTAGVANIITASVSGAESANYYSTYTAGTASKRWAYGKNDDAESGSNAGSDFFINRYDDNGNYLDRVMNVKRSNGNVAIGGNFNAQKRLHVSGGTRTDSLQITIGAANGYVLQSNGSGNGTWVNPTTLAITETDPKVALATVNYMPKWNGTALVDGMVYDNGSNVGIGTVTPASTLSVNGSLSVAVTTTNGSLTLAGNHNHVIYTGGAGNTFTLPAASAATGRVYVIINHGTDALTTSSYRTGNATIATSVAVDSSIKIISDGTEWRLIN
jgi:hypothetical protein